MRLHLTSYRIPAPKALFKLIGKNPEDTTVGIIPNAGDYYAERARGVRIGEIHKHLQAMGFKTRLVDLRDYTDSLKLKEVLKSFDAIWVSGGNTFCLREEMRRSGFEKIIDEVLKSGVVYCGESAGAVAAGTSLSGIESADNPLFAKSVIKTGLKLTPYYILPHADNPNFAQANIEAKELHGSDPFFVELNDSQTMIIDGEDMKIIEAE